MFRASTAPHPLYSDVIPSVRRMPMKADLQTVRQAILALSDIPRFQHINTPSVELKSN